MIQAITAQNPINIRSMLENIYEETTFPSTTKIYIYMPLIGIIITEDESNYENWFSLIILINNSTRKFLYKTLAFG